MTVDAVGYVVYGFKKQNSHGLHVVPGRIEYV